METAAHEISSTSVGGESESESELELDGVTLDFSGLRAIDHVSFSVRRGELFSIIGPNGAGKTSLFNCISGVYRPSAGTIRRGGIDITGWRPHRVAASQVARTFQNVEAFGTMTVLESMLLGRNSKLRSGLVAGALWWGRAVHEEVEARRKVEEVIEFLEIESLRHAPVGSLPHGLRKRVELGRALSMDPTLLLLDEPVAGMNVEETEDMVRFVLDVHDELGITVVLVEHDMGVVMDISDRVAVLDFGQLVAVGEPSAIARDPRVLSCYLGQTQVALKDTDNGTDSTAEA